MKKPSSDIVETAAKTAGILQLEEVEIPEKGQKRKSKKRKAEEEEILECEHCKMIFVGQGHRAALRQHKVSVHNSLAVFCGWCSGDFHFSCPSNLRKHVKTAHSEVDMVLLDSNVIGVFAWDCNTWAGPAANSEVEAFSEAFLLAEEWRAHSQISKKRPLSINSSQQPQKEEKREEVEEKDFLSVRVEGRDDLDENLESEKAQKIKDYDSLGSPQKSQGVR